MKRTILTLSVALTTSITCYSQVIEMKKSFFGYKFFQNENALTWGDLLTVMRSNDEAFALAKKARSSNTIANILGGAGGLLIGLPIGAAIGGGKANWTLAGIGAGLVVIGIPIAIGANKKIKQAVERYNQGLKTTSFYRVNPKFKIIANAAGIGLVIRF